MDVIRLEVLLSCTGCTIEEGVDFRGHEIPGMNNIAVTDQDDCARRCFTEDGCNFWSFQSSGNHCWLRTSDSGRQANQAVNSGSKGCGGQSGKCIYSIIIKTVFCLHEIDRANFRPAELVCWTAPKIAILRIFAHRDICTTCMLHIYRWKGFYTYIYFSSMHKFHAWYP